MKKLILLYFACISIIQQSQTQVGVCGVPTDEPPGCFLCSPIYHGSTANYTQGTPGTSFPCGSVENNQWISIIAGESHFEATIQVTYCEEYDDNGVQMILFNVDLDPVSTCYTSGPYPWDEKEPGVIVADNLTPGEVYWLMIDGFAGDICDFMLTVSSSIYTGPPDPPGQIQQTPEVDSICPSAIICYSVPVPLNAFHYEWTIPDNATLISGGGESDTVACVRFNGTASGKICVHSYNSCHTGVRVCKDFDISSIHPTLLPDIEVHPNDFPVEIDENTFAAAGRYEITLLSSLGCDSTVVYNILSCPGASESINTTICSGTSFIVGDSIFSNPGNYTVVMPGKAVGGCDSTVILSLQVNDDISIQDYQDIIECFDDCLDLEVEAGSFPGNFTYQWTTTDGMISGPIDHLTTSVCGPGHYSLIFTNQDDGTSCTVTTNITPNEAIDGPLDEISFDAFQNCTGTPLLFTTTFLKEIDYYEWIIPPGATVTGTRDSSFIELTFDAPGDYSLCVRGINQCDTTLTICNDFTIKTTPQSDFEADDQICMGSQAVIQYTGNAGAGANFHWNFDEGIIINGNGEGPYTVEWNNAGIYCITLQVEENGCLSEPVMQNIIVEDTLVQPTIYCLPGLDSIAFKWFPVVGAINYEILIDSQFIGFQTETEYIAENLGPNKTIAITVIPHSINDRCPGRISSSSCITDCPDITSYIPSDTSLCRNSAPIDLPVVPSLGSECNWTGSGVQQHDCRFYPYEAQVGENWLRFRYDDGRCEYEESFGITVAQAPFFTSEVTSPVWQNYNLGEIEIDLTIPDPVHIFWSNGFDQTDLEAPPGRYCVTVWDESYTCSSADCFLILEAPFRISPVYAICSGESAQLKVRPGFGANFQWTPATGLSCTNCPNPKASPTTSRQYSVRATLPDGRQGSTSVFVLVLPPPFCPNSMNADFSTWQAKAIGELRKFEKFKHSDDNELLALLSIDSPDYNSEEIIIYPNPFEDNLVIEIPDESEAEIELFNSNGNMLFRQEIMAGNKILNLKEFSPGSYFIRIKSNYGIYTKKIIKL